MNPGTGESDPFSLPAAKWSVVGTGEGPEETIKLSCGGAGIGFSLDEPSQGAIGARLTTGCGAGTLEHCVLFGGTLVEDVAGSFRARGAILTGETVPRR